MADEEAPARAMAEGGKREPRITGLSDLLPDWILPPEGKQHIRNARKELLLAVRSVLDQAIEFQERGGRARRPSAKIEVE